VKEQVEQQRMLEVRGKQDSKASLYHVRCLYLARNISGLTRRAKATDTRAAETRVRHAQGPRAQGVVYDLDAQSHPADEVSEDTWKLVA
jgi:hypothetical protein